MGLTQKNRKKLIKAWRLVQGKHCGCYTFGGLVQWRGLQSLPVSPVNSLFSGMWDGVPGSLLVNSQGSIMLDCFPVLPKPVIVVILELLTEKYILNTWNNAYHSPIHSLPWSSKSPTYKPSSCELSKIQTCVRISNHIGQFTCLVYIVTCVQPLKVVVLLCTLLYSTVQNTEIEYLYFNPRMSRASVKAVKQLVLLYFSRYYTRRLKCFF